MSIRVCKNCDFVIDNRLHREYNCPDCGSDEMCCPLEDKRDWGKMKERQDTFVELLLEINRKIKWVNKRGNSYFDRKSETYSVHGAWQKGYYEGILSTLEDMMDFVSKPKKK